MALDIRAGSEGNALILNKCGNMVSRGRCYSVNDLAPKGDR